MKCLQASSNPEAKFNGAHEQTDRTPGDVVVKDCST